jgi:hypothetical protein
MLRAAATTSSAFNVLGNVGGGQHVVKHVASKVVDV